MLALFNLKRKTLFLCASLFAIIWLLSFPLLFNFAFSTLNVNIVKGTRNISFLTRPLLSTDAIKEVCEQAKGVYDKLINNTKALTMFQNTVLVVSPNSAYLDFLINWSCSLKRVSQYRFIVVPQDEELAHYLRDNTDFLILNGSLLGVHSPSEQSGDFQSLTFNHITMQKIQTVRTLLELGYDVLFNDVDVVWLEDPLHHFRGDVDLEIQTEHFSQELGLEEQPNTGFYWVKSSEGSKELWRRTELEWAQGNQHLDDQTVMATILKRWRMEGKAVQLVGENGDKEEKVFKFRQLNPVQFPSGLYYFWEERNMYEQELARTGQSPVIAHINYVWGGDRKEKKIKELKARNLWYVQGNQQQGFSCKTANKPTY